MDCSGECISDVDGDGVCDEFEIVGCTSEWAENYNNEATDDDGSCFLNGCTSEWADNYNSNASIDDNSCFNEGCMELWADNYDSLATQNNLEENECWLEACMDPSACNFNSNATADDGTCYNNDLGCGCDTPAAYLVYDCDGVCLIDTDGDGFV